MKAGFAALVVIALLAASLGAAGIAAAAGERDLAPIVERGRTERLGGGEWISVRAGDARVGVVYGSADHPNGLYVFAEYKRFLGAADFYDGAGNFLGTRPIPVYTVFGQSFVGMIEFQDGDGDGLLNFYRYDRNDTAVDLPSKATRLLNRTWTASEPTVETAGETTYVNFTVGTRNVPYEIVWDPLPRRGLPTDGALDDLSFTFHLQIDVREVSGDVPWWKVTIDDGSPRRVLDVEYLGNRTVSGPAVAMGAKYDHHIAGWDFARGADRLALETRAFVGHHAPAGVGHFVHDAYRTEARDDGGYRHRENDTEAPDPTLLTRDYVYFNDEWDRVGRLVWASDVTVDGRADTMYFQVQGGERWGTFREGAAFAGFAIRGAYVYPSGLVIDHDPGLEAVSQLWALPEALNLTPLMLLAIQGVIAGIAMGPALLLRARGRRAK